MEPLLYLHQWGAHEHPSLMSPNEASPGNGLLLFFPCRRLRDGAEEGTLSGRQARRRTPREPEHSNNGVFTPDPGRILRDDQCPRSARANGTCQTAA